MNEKADELQPQPVVVEEMEIVQLAIVENNNEVSCEEDNEAIQWKAKEKQLIKRLKAKHCRPLVNLCMLMATEGFEEDIDDATSQQRTQILLMTQARTKLAQLKGDEDGEQGDSASGNLASMIKVESKKQPENQQSALQVRDLFESLTCQDLEQILECESFKPQVFTNYIKLMKQLYELR